MVKMKQGILMDNNLAAKGEDVIINSGMEQSLASTVPDYGRFKEGDIFSSTVAPASSSHSKGTRHLPHKNTSKTPVKLGLRSNERQKGIKSPESSKLSTPSTMWRRNSSKLLQRDKV